MPDASRVEYDELAWLYDRYMAADFSRRVQTAIERLLLQELQAGARILDVCCGTGQMARLLSDAGYRVTGFCMRWPLVRLRSRRRATHY